MSEADWKSSLPAEIQSHGALANYKDVGSLAKSHIELTTKLSQPIIDRFEMPKDDAGIATFRRKIGVPENADGYELPKDKPTAVKFSEWGHKAGLTKDQARAIFNEIETFGTATRTQQETERKNQQTARKTEVEAALRGEFKDKYDGEMAAYNAGLEYLYPDEKRRGTFGELTFHGPDEVKRIITIGKALKEGQFKGGAGNVSGVPTDAAGLKVEREKIQNQMLEMSDKPGFDPVAPAYRDLVNKRQELLTAEGKAKLGLQQGAA